MEETQEGLTKVLLPIELRVNSCTAPVELRGQLSENAPVATPLQLESDFEFLDSYKVHSPHFKLDGKKIVSRQVFDREKMANYHINVTDAKNAVIAVIRVKILDENDNLPVFNLTSTRLLWKIKPTDALKYAIVGKVSAYDPDEQDQVVYGLDHSDPCCIVVPQTGEVMLVDPEKLPAQLTILAKEKDFPSRQSKLQAMLDILDEDDIIDDNDLEPHLRMKRRATRAVRPTKRTEFTEADGQVEGKIVFQLEKESQHETFKIRDENPWVTVEPNGAVRVKKRWDYEELGREKTIDFWVIITNSGAAGKIKIHNDED